MTRAEKAKQYIIEQTAPIFNTKGLAGTVIGDVMGATKMARGSLYVHFKNMDELALCAVEYNLKLFIERTSAVSDQYSTAKEKFLGLLDYLSDPLNPPVQGGCPMMNFGMEADDTSPVIREKVNDTICGVQQGMAEILEAGVQNGEFRKDWDFKTYAVKAYAMIEGGILISRMSQNISQMTLLVNILKAELEANAIS